MLAHPFLEAAEHYVPETLISNQQGSLRRISTVASAPLNAENRYAAAIQVALALDHLQQVLVAAIADDIELPPRRRWPADSHLLGLGQIHPHRGAHPVPLGPQDFGDNVLEGVHGR